jgi:hypothetical protein
MSLARLTPAVATVVAVGAVFAASACSSTGSGNPGAGSSPSGSHSAALTSTPPTPISSDPQTLLEAAKQYVSDTSHPVRLQGSGTDSGQSVSLDMQYVGDDSSGTFGILGGTAQSIAIAGTVYFKFDNALWKAVAPSDATQIEALVGGKWLKANSSDSQFADFVSLALRSFVTDQMLAPTGTLSLGAPKTVNGVACQGIVDSGSDGIGTLYVADDNSRPIQIASGGAVGALNFSYAPATVPSAPAPADVLDVSALPGG